MDEPCGHYAKQDESDREGRILYVTYMWNLKKSIHKNRDQNGSYQALNVEGNGEVLVKGYKLQVKDE